MFAFALLNEIGKFCSEKLGRHLGSGIKHPESMGDESEFWNS